MSKKIPPCIHSWLSLEGPFLENLQMDFLIAGWKWPQLDKAGVTVAKKEGGKKKDGGCQMA